MPKMLVGRGTLLNTATVTAGALLGWPAGAHVPTDYKDLTITVMALVTLGLGIRLFLHSKNILIIAGSLAIGGCLGTLFGLQHGLEAFAQWTKGIFGAEGSNTFAEAIVTTSVIFCVGPMTLLGCLKDALEDDIELLAIKSTMDGFGAFFFAAALGPGVLVTAGVVLVVQGAITIAASPLRRFAGDETMIAEATAAGGVMLSAIGLTLLDLKEIPVANLTPALFLAPIFVALSRKSARRAPQDVSSNQAP